jgi:DNA-3-methyladenine glycosylase
MDSFFSLREPGIIDGEGFCYMPKILPQKFYNRPTLQVAQDLLGCFLVRKINGEIIRAMIVETEGYFGYEDKASHASRGKTDRNEPMFWEGGITYVYLVYGMHSLLNIVTEKENYPAAVLIRAVDFNWEESSSNDKKGSGPGKLTKILEIDRSLNKQKIYNKKNNLWLEESIRDIKKNEIVKTKRVGIDYAEEYRDKPWRFYLADNKNVSKK